MDGVGERVFTGNGEKFGEEVGICPGTSAELSIMHLHGGKH